MHRCVSMPSDINSLYINCFTILQKWSKWPSWYTPLIEVNQAKLVWSFRQTFHTLQKLYTNSKQLSTQRDAENVYFSLQWVIIWKRFRSNTPIIFQFFGGSYFFNILQFLLISEICISLGKKNSKDRWLCFMEVNDSFYKKVLFYLLKKHSYITVGHIFKGYKKTISA